jgi:hypothetical protein
MSLRRLLVPLVALLLLGPGCGDSSKGSSGAGTRASGILSINAPSDVIKCGACQPFTATYTRGGVAQTVTPTWRTDNSAVATIDASGQLTPIAHGDVTVTAEYQEARASKMIHVVNDYGALWYGNYLITDCRATGGFDPRDWCSIEGFGSGQTLPLGLDLQQDRDRVNGTLWLGDLNGPFSGSVASGGNLTGESRFTFTYESGVLDILVSPLSALREGERITQGHFTVVFSMAGVPGNCTFDTRILALDKAPAVRALGRQAPGAARTLRDVWRLMRQR